jgi:hypothetical protein
MEHDVALYVDAPRVSTRATAHVAVYWLPRDSLQHLLGWRDVIEPYDACKHGKRRAIHDSSFQYVNSSD